ncbi:MULTISPECIES: putative nucleotide-diphospho-sugar transferase [Acinetobacter]|jgi:hypothetical protein|uniref:Glycosyltransferase family 77 protein n=2 Tax=Moraxellaceae TaxID=468 RepID=A0A4Q4E0D4_ACILW|nr:MULTISPECIES: putative nucleotide-diphospho-sugar transferase [Acinetobacter]SPJ20846.1 Nucleotide-diphospho-sugar transferase [Prolinoborus fasciculus]EEY91048.1 hypothetical protein HMPREF0017_00061 [Acinetobacter lwoffii SH145]ENW30110.1 hypothetical protein F924_00512 [Acinetobacter lwoffii ATCC 9957 = CIP 70.31]ENX24565.1 hypothetical protein F893_01166 [Acinetobacter sp. CIP 102136]ENX28298.1 hypothetical protein F890_02918 [Acinetobacter sp. CIP 64.7]
MLTVFGFHTDDKLYTKHAQILAESAKKFNIHILLKQFSKDDWQTIIAFKPVFISQMRRETHGPLLFVDADAIILEDIRPYFNAIEEDIAVHYIDNKRLISSTIFINDTKNAHSLMDEWEKRMLQNPTIWDQIILQNLVDEWHDAGLITLKKLPPNYTFIFDTSRNLYGDKIQPSIEQLQASRDKRWIQKYEQRNSIYQWIMRSSLLSKSTKKIVKRHNEVNARTTKLGIDIKLTLSDLIE